MRKPGSHFIFILGVMQRSGTNYLNNLLLLHPDCDYPGYVWEDYLIAHAEHLSDYVRSVHQSWKPSWKNRVEESMDDDSLMKCIGEGLGLFMNRQYESSLKTGQRRGRETGKDVGEFPKLVSATPSVRGLKHFFHLFPHARLAIIIRDGRSIVESGMKSFDWDFEHAVRRWRKSAETILEFDHAAKKGSHMIIRYEDMYTNTRDTITKVLSFLGLNTERYDFDAAVNLTVTGSSDLKDSEGTLHWKAREKRSDFNPLGRWSQWQRSQHERFNWLAGDYLERFAYRRIQYGSWDPLWKFWNRVLDHLYGCESWLQSQSLSLYKPVQRLRKLIYVLPGKFLAKKTAGVSTGDGA